MLSEIYKTNKLVKQNFLLFENLM